MKHLLSPHQLQSLAAVCLALVTLPAIVAQQRCPGNTASVPSRLVQHALIVIPVRINQSGPFDFVVDTGSQVTVIDPSLAAELGLKAYGRVGVVSVSSLAQASATLLESLEACSRVVKGSPAIVHDLRSIQAADARIRGVLGESFLAHFDLFIDYGHKLLCLDETSGMRDNICGERISLIPPLNPEGELPFMERLVISVRLSGTGEQPILLQLDSGSDGPVLYAGSERPAVQALLRSATLRGASATSAQRAFAVLPPQIMQIGNHIRSDVSFVTPVATATNFGQTREDGLLPTVLFQRIFISGRGHYVVFEPK